MTAAREPEMGLTFEKVWALFQESERRMREMGEETDRKIQEVAQQIKKTDEQMKKTDEQMKKTDAQMKKTDEQMGRLGNRFGELAEHLVAPNIVEKFNALGYHFDDISSGRRRIIKEEKSGRKIAEFDILLENGESIIGVEVKSSPSSGDVQDHVRRLEILRFNKDEKGDKRKIHGALAGAIMLDDVKAAVLEAGLYAIVQAGDTMKIDVPKNFVPKAW